VISKGTDDETNQQNQGDRAGLASCAARTAQEVREPKAPAPSCPTFQEALTLDAGRGGEPGGSRFAQATSRGVSARLTRTPPLPRKQEVGLAGACEYAVPRNRKRGQDAQDFFLETSPDPFSCRDEPARS
jgi:hypothetical protein